MSAEVYMAALGEPEREALAESLLRELEGRGKARAADFGEAAGPRERSAEYLGAPGASAPGAEYLKAGESAAPPTFAAEREGAARRPWAGAAVLRREPEAGVRAQSGAQTWAAPVDAEGISEAVRRESRRFAGPFERY